MMWRRHWSALYLVWIAVCAALFAGFAHREDPSRRHGRILSNEAAEIATRIVRAQGPRYRDYDVVHVAYAGRGEAGTDEEWVVLCDAVPRSGLRDGIVVELRAKDGTLLRLRKPEGRRQNAEFKMEKFAAPLSHPAPAILNSAFCPLPSAFRS